MAEGCEISVTILLDRSVSISKRLKYFNAVVSSVACFGSGHRAIYTPSWPLWMFSFENYADQSLDRRQKLIGMRIGMRFFIYGMNGSEILLQMHTLIHGLTSHAKTTGIWPGMLPLYLQIGGCNACYRGILLVLVAWAVHDILGNPNVTRIAGTQIWDHGEKWRTSCGTHIYLHVSFFAACK